jgi:hypothetical protein
MKILCVGGGDTTHGASAGVGVSPTMFKKINEQVRIKILKKIY